MAGSAAPIRHDDDLEDLFEDEAGESEDRPNVESTADDYFEDEVSQVLAAEGWLELPMTSRFAYRRVENAAPIQSPLAQASRTRKLTNTNDWPEVSEGVRSLWESIRSRQSQSNDAMCTGAAISREGYNAYSAYFPVGNVDRTSHHEVPIPQFLLHEPDKPAFRLRMDAVFGPFAEPSDLEENDGKIMKIRRFAKPTANTKEIGYFLVNSSLGQLCVNQQLFGPNTIIGPLPDFSIIEVGPRPIFWWRTPEALNFSPRSRRSVRVEKRKREEDSDQASPGSEGRILKKLKSMSDAIVKFSAAQAHFIQASPPAEKRGTPAAGIDDVNDLLRESSETGEADADAPPPVSWATLFQEGMVRCYAYPRASSDRSHDIEGPSNLYDEDVCLAIASVWCALQDCGVNFAFAHPNTFQWARSAILYDQIAVGSRDCFVIPLFFRRDEAIEEEVEDHQEPEPAESFRAASSRLREANRENVVVERRTRQEKVVAEKVVPEGNKQQGPRTGEASATGESSGGNLGQARPPARGPITRAAGKQRSKSEEERERARITWLEQQGVGHHIVAIATRLNDGRIRVEYLDSLPQHRSRGEIRRAARNVMRFTGWPDLEWPEFVDESWPEVAVQSMSGNTCGVHSILNAWARMLKIPLSSRHQVTFDDMFYQVAHEIINLALSGSMDLATIRAFLHSSGYGQEQSVAAWEQQQATATESQRRADGMRTVQMNEGLLQEFLEPMRDSWWDVHFPALSDSHSMRDQQPQVSGDPAEQPTSLAESASHDVPDLSGGTATDLESSKPAAPPSDPPFRTWQQRMVAGLAPQQYRASRPQSQGEQYAEVKDVTKMTPGDVLIAMAALWEGLRRGGSMFAFPASSMKSDQVLAVVGGPHKLILPCARKVTIPKGGSESTAKVEDHHSLYVFELVQAGSPPIVNIDIYDSTPDQAILKMNILAAVRRVRNSTWLGVGANGVLLAKALIPQDIRNQPMPHHRDPTTSTSALYTVLSAWAAMLNIPLSGRALPLPGQPLRAFLHQSRDMLTHTLRGRNDAATIQAFLNHTGFAAPQDPHDPAIHVKPQVQSARMNPSKLRLTLDAQRDRDIVAAFRAAGNRIPERDLQDFLEMNGLTDAEWGAAEEALVLAGGDFAVAGEVFWRRRDVSSPTSEQSAERML